MNPLTLTATVLISAFQTFPSLQKAQAFMDALPATACASLSYGVAVTEEERRAKDAAYGAWRREEARRLEEESADYQRCLKEAAELNKRVVYNHVLAKWPLPKTRTLAWSTNWKTMERSYTCMYVHNESSIYIFSEPDAVPDKPRWVVTYKKEKS